MTIHFFSSQLPQPENLLRLIVRSFIGTNGKTARGELRSFDFLIRFKTTKSVEIQLVTYRVVVGRTKNLRNMETFYQRLVGKPCEIEGRTKQSILIVVTYRLSGGAHGKEYQHTKSESRRNKQNDVKYNVVNVSSYRKLQKKLSKTHDETTVPLNRALGMLVG